MSDPHTPDYICKLEKDILSPVDQTSEADCSTRYKNRL